MILLLLLSNGPQSTYFSFNEIHSDYLPLGFKSLELCLHSGSVRATHKKKETLLLSVWFPRVSNSVTLGASDTALDPEL